MVNHGAFITYLRVSTQQQGRSGLGLEAQRAAVASYLGGSGWRIIGEYVEVESGKNSARPQLDAALEAARLRQVPIVVAKVDRLTRSLSFLMKLLDAGVDVRFVDLPQIEGPTGRFMLQQMAAVAELEGGLISARTKAALKAAKARGKVLGGFRGYTPSAEDVAKGVKLRQDRAAKRAADLAPIVKAAQAAGAESLRTLAAELDRQHIPAPRGGGWNAKQVSRLLAQIEGV